MSLAENLCTLFENNESLFKPESSTLFQRWWNWYEITVVANFYIYIYIHIHACTYSLFVNDKRYDKVIMKHFWASPVFSPSVVVQAAKRPRGPSSASFLDIQEVGKTLSFHEFFNIPVEHTPDSRPNTLWFKGYIGVRLKKGPQAPGMSDWNIFAS